uniref:Uncharacterized protein n=1 Tax=Pseudonaja textilis TaxID=8673 RepID=A0A670YBQ3_PSETE
RIHELLLELHGFPGGLFVGGSLQVSPELPLFLHPNEVALLACICHLGVFYICLHEFTEQFNKHTQLLQVPSLPSLCGGLWHWFFLCLLTLAV